MKIIDLLNKIFEWSQVGVFGGNYYKEYDFTPLNVYTNLSSPDILNSEVEVIE